LKDTNAIDELILKLSEMNIAGNNELTTDSENASISSLIAFFEEATQDESKEILEKLLSEAGYDWMGLLDANEIALISKLYDAAIDEQFSIPEIPLTETPALFSEDEFMNLIPVNGYFH